MFFFTITEKLHLLLIEQGGVRALLGMVRSGNNDVIAQVARGLANFAKCETRAITQGQQYYIIFVLNFLHFWSLSIPDFFSFGPYVGFLQRFWLLFQVK